MGAITVAMAFIPDQRKPLWFGVVSLAVLIDVYWQRGGWRKLPATQYMRRANTCAARQLDLALDVCPPAAQLQ